MHGTRFLIKIPFSNILILHFEFHLIYSLLKLAPEKVRTFDRQVDFERKSLVVSFSNLKYSNRVSWAIPQKKQPLHFQTENPVKEIILWPAINCFFLNCSYYSISRNNIDQKPPFFPRIWSILDHYSFFLLIGTNEEESKISFLFFSLTFKNEITIMYPLHHVEYPSTLFPRVLNGKGQKVYCLNNGLAIILSYFTLHEFLSHF